MYMYTKGSLAGAAAQQQAPRDPEPRRNPNRWASRAAFLLQIHTGGGGSKRQNPDKTHTTPWIQNGGLQLGSPATCKLKSFRGFYGFREDIREARALREIDRSVVSAAIRVSSVQNIVKRNMKVNSYAIWQAPKTGRNFEAAV
jgi:hypothetical protein